MSAQSDAALLALAVCQASLVLLASDDALRAVRREGNKAGPSVADWFARSRAATLEQAAAQRDWRQATIELRDARGDG